MRFLLPLFIDGMASFLSILPFLIILEIFARKQIPSLSFSQLMGDWFFCLCLSAIFAVTGIPPLYDMHFTGNRNLIPFADITANTIQYVLNVLLFLPVGFLLPLQFPGFRKAKRCVLYGFLTSLTIELLQLFSFRAADIDDLLMNTLGCAAGYWLYTRIALWRAEKEPPSPDNPLSAGKKELSSSNNSLSAGKKEPPCRFRQEALCMTAVAWAGALLLAPAVRDVIWTIFL